MPLKFFLAKPAFKCIVKVSILIQIPIRNTVKKLVNEVYDFAWILF